MKAVAVLLLCLVSAILAENDQMASDKENYAPYGTYGNQGMNQYGMYNRYPYGQYGQYPYGQYGQYGQYGGNMVGQYRGNMVGQYGMGRRR